MLQIKYLAITVKRSGCQFDISKIGRVVFYELPVVGFNCQVLSSTANFDDN
jgi:hypothetical protein